MDVEGISTAATIPRVTIAVIHWGSLDDTRACIASLLALEYAAYDILLMDNGSGCGDALAEIAASDERIAIHVFQENTGFTGATNFAARRARDQGSRFVWFVNNDAIADAATVLTHLVRETLARDVALASPVLRNVANGSETRCRGASFFPGLALTLHRGGRVEALLRKIARVHMFISGTALLVDLEKVSSPVFDDALFAYCEDVDLALRVGPDQIFVCDSAVVRHVVSSSTGGGLKKHYLKARNLVYVARKHGMFGLVFCISFWSIFAVSESRKYLASLIPYWKTTRNAWSAGKVLGTSR